ncbi:MAG: hypothetical protein ACFFBP_22820 [Promethearchaeota archaeon]
MAIIETKINNTEFYKSISIICPVCKTQKPVNIPKWLIDDAKQITTISISKNIVCKHHFQCFIDKNYAVRGYQTVDYQIENDENFDSYYVDDKKLFKNLVLSNNELKYNNEKLIGCQNRVNSSQKMKIMSLEEIYEEFWEFIDEENEEFIELIKKDPRRY